MAGADPGDPMPGPLCVPCIVKSPRGARWSGKQLASRALHDSLHVGRTEDITDALTALASPPPAAPSAAASAWTWRNGLPDVGALRAPASSTWEAGALGALRAALRTAR